MTLEIINVCWSISVDNDRYRYGPIFGSYKSLKRLFRKIPRQCANNVFTLNSSQYSNLFMAKNCCGEKKDESTK